jgi:hypothetical protein
MQPNGQNRINDADGCITLFDSAFRPEAQTNRFRNYFVWKADSFWKNDIKVEKL